ncbi:VanZ family protein [Alicyclobacillus fastidiosus]|uniref:VanZ family protein n=1 Tax=Alicyclobacillus fastidiosus TaxID=392011 RepID=A0ABY6ZFZ9_9BACL|nr:VanZ family protein [Alicyclobacillus fastidiosus]WAH41761.1 VanZ family protein [Alicyclobacillus fastidiosus]GMA63453.1 hypothetical protein GCM10025859_38930 [Alicyclobacillus fastidiosus]
MKFSSKGVNSILRLVWVIVWACVLAYFTCSVDPFHFHISYFHFTGRPHWRDLLLIDFHFLQPLYLISKIGHFCGFMIFDLLLFNLIRRSTPSACIAIALGIASELFQLGFGRDGRLYDMVIDALGVGVSVWLQKKLWTNHGR